MKNHRPSLDNRLLALLTVSFSLMCAGALWIDLGSNHDQTVAAART